MNSFISNQYFSNDKWTNFLVQKRKKPQPGIICQIYERNGAVKDFSKLSFSSQNWKILAKYLRLFLNGAEWYLFIERNFRNFSLIDPTFDIFCDVTVYHFYLICASFDAFLFYVGVAWILTWMDDRVSYVYCGKVTKITL